MTKPVELNIINRGVVSTEWNKSPGNLTEQLINSISENNTQKTSALNALPTPFARLYIFDNAFREVQSLGDRASDSSKQLVSDCLDVFELLFNIDYHSNRNEKIIIKKWSKDIEIPKLRKNTDYIGNSLNAYLSDTEFHDIKDFYFVVYISDGNEIVLAGTSPFTYFYTPPALDKSKNLNGSTIFVQDNYQAKLKLKKPNHQTYFKNIVKFEDRSEEFKSYMYNLFNGLNTTTAINFRDFIVSKGNSVNRTLNIDLQPIICETAETLTIFDVLIKKHISDANFDPLTDYLIRINYPIDQNRFKVPIFIGNNADRYGYLLPIKPEILSSIDLSEINHTLTLEGTNRYRYKLVIGDDVFERIYNNSEVGKAGRIIDISEDYNINFNIGIFPFVKSQIADLNNYYQVGLFFWDAHDHTNYQNSDFKCSFYKLHNGRYHIISENGATHGFSYSERNSIQDDRKGVNFFEIYNTEFDIIAINIKIEGTSRSGIIIPKFNIVNNSENKKFKFAVDFGTTNTHVAYTYYTGDNTMAPKSFDITLTDRQMVLLNAPSDDTGLTPVDKIEKCNFTNLRNEIKSHFVPSLINEGNYAAVKFPIRTALLEKDGVDRNRKLFSDSNINFYYEKLYPSDGQTNITDIKWDRNNIQHIKVFIKEILHIIRSKVILNGGMPSSIELKWFSPLSFNFSKHKDFEDIWNELATQILGIKVSDIINISESEAPYYYYFESGEIRDISKVAIIDIGGGSVDYVVFKDTKPQFATSAHFGCNVLWGNGFSNFKNSKDNLIYRTCKEKITQSLSRTTLNELNSNFLNNEKNSTADIINFWISNEDQTQIKDLLKESRFTPMFLYHFSATVFHLVQCMKIQNLEVPSALVFSGNGSKYLDFFLNKQMITDFVNFIFSSLYDNQKANIQVILPKERKESTAYGGLYFNNRSNLRAKKLVYLGTRTSIPNLHELEISKLKVQKRDQDLLSKVADNVNDFVALYIEMIKRFHLVRELDLKINAEDLLNYLKSSTLESLETGYQKLIQGVSDTDVLNNSLFFLPLIKQLFELPNTEAISKARYAKRLYFKLPEDLQKRNFLDSLSAETYFEFNQISENKAEINLVTEPNIMKNAMTNFEDHLEKLCEYDQYPSAKCQSYEQELPGEAILDADTWKVTDKVKIKFN